MTTVDKISALINKAEDLETRAQGRDKRLLEDTAKAYGEATKLAEKHLGSLSEETLTLRERWADSVRDTGNLAEATTCHLKNVEWTLKSLEQHQRQHSSSELIAIAQERHLYAQRQLAETYLADNKFSEAISLYENIQISKASRSQEEIYKDRADLASALFKSGSDRNIMRAVNLNAETLQKADQNLGRSHIETVRIRFNLARELYSLKKYSDASEKYEELLKILEAKGCQARSAPDYNVYLQDTKASLRSCTAKIAQEREEKRKAEKSRKDLQNQVEEKKSVMDKGNEASASTHKTGKKNQGEKLTEPEPPKAQESQKSRPTDVSTHIKPARGKTDKDRTQERPDKEKRDEVESSPRTEEQAKRPGLMEETNCAADKPRKYSAKEGSSKHQSNAKPKADSATAVSVVNPELGSTKQSSRDPERYDSNSKPVVDRPRDTDGSKPSTRSEAKRDLPIRPHSACDTLSPHSATEIESKRVRRTNSTRSDAGRSKRDRDQKDESIASKDWKLEGKSTNQKEPTPSVPKNGKTEQENTDSSSTKKLEKKQSSTSSTSVTQPSDKKRDSDVMKWVMRTPTYSTSKEQESSEATEKEKHGNGEPPRSHERSSEQKSPQKSSAPSIVLSKPEHREETKRRDSTKPSFRSQTDRERPSSSQSHYHKVDSSLDIVNMDRANRRGQRSRSSDSKRVSQPKTEDELEKVSKPKSITGKSTREKTLPISDTGEELQHSRPPGNSGSKRIEKRSTDRVETLDKVITEKPVFEPNPVQTEEKIQEPYLWVDACEYFEHNNPGNEDVRPHSSSVAPSQSGGTSSEIKLDRSKPLETAAPAEPVPVISTDTLNTGRVERIVPGGWHQDFDEPDLNQRMRKVRSNNALSQGGLRVSQASDTGHRRASSVDMPRPTPMPKKMPHIQDWGYMEEVIADEWFDRLQKNTHAFLDKYQDDCYGMAKATRRVRIAVLDTGVARSTAKGPVPSLMKGPKVKIGKVLDPTLPWNMDNKGHGTHAAGLILTVCPYADVYVYRVCEGNSDIDKKHVADAILDAVDKKKVDIISMSLGWEDNSHSELRRAVLHARASSVLLFAASSNEGVRTKAGMAFPARAPEVIAVDAADVHGRPLRSNPPGTRNQGRIRLTALGEAVRSTWPMDLPTEEPETGWKRLAGTSCATPIAAGIAGLVLEFSRQRPMCFEQEIERHLKTVEGMHLTLRHLLSVECDTDVRFNNLDPTKLFHVTREDDDGGDWAKPLCPRFNAASDIVKVLRNEYGDEIGVTMGLELRKEMGRRYQ